MLVLSILSLIILIRPYLTIEPSTESPERTRCVLRDFFSIQNSGTSEPERESTPSKDACATSSSDDDLELRLNTALRSSKKQKSQPSSIDNQQTRSEFQLGLGLNSLSHRASREDIGPSSQHHQSPSPVYGTANYPFVQWPSLQHSENLATVEQKLQAPEVNANEDFWNPSTIKVVTEVDELTGRPKCHVILNPSDGPELSNRYPEEEIVLQYLLDKKDNPPKQDRSQEIISLPFTFTTERGRKTFRRIGGHQFVTNRFAYASNKLSTIYKKFSRNACEARRFNWAAQQGGYELKTLKLPISLYADGLVDHPSNYRLPQKPKRKSPSYSSPGVPTPANRHGKFIQNGDELSREGPTSTSKAKALSTASRSCKQGKLSQTCAPPTELKAAKAWINQSLPGVIHIIRILYTLFPNLCRESGKTIKQLQWEAWCFYYIFVNNLERLHQSESGEQLWKDKSIMSHEMMVKQVDRTAWRQVTSIQASKICSTVSKRMLVLWLSCKHQNFYNHHCTGDNGLNERFTTMMNSVYLAPMDFSDSL